MKSALVFRISEKYINKYLERREEIIKKEEEEEESN